MPESSHLPTDSRRGASTRVSVVNAWNKLSPNVRGAAYVSLGALILVVMASLVKELGKTIPVFEIIFVRFLAGFLGLTLVIGRMGFGRLRTKKPLLHLLRGFAGFMGNTCFFFALVHLAISDAVTIQFSRPLIMAVVAALFLGEIIGWRRSIATLFGFAGVLMITRPFTGGFEPWALVALGGAAIGTLVILMIKLLTRTESTLVIMFYFALFTTLFSLVPTIFVWQTPTWSELALLVLCGVLGTIGQSLFTHGIGLGETSFVMPFDYLRIVYSFIVGFVWFYESPGIWSFAGTAVIVVSSLYLLRTQMGRSDKPTLYPANPD